MNSGIRSAFSVALVVATGSAWVGAHPVLAADPPKPPVKVDAKPTPPPAPAAKPPAPPAPKPAAAIQTEPLPPPPSPGVLATVNGQDVTRDELVTYLIKRYASSALDQLIDQKIQEQAATKQGVVISDEDLKIEYDAYKLSAPSPQVFDDYEKRVGRDMIMENLRPRIVYKKIGEKLVTVNPSDLDEVRASHILIRVEATPDEAARKKADEAAKKKVDEIMVEVKKPGADFAALAKKYSQDPGSAMRGGDLDFFGKGQMVPPFEQAAFAAKIGDLLGPIKSDFGYHIIKVTDRKESSKLSKAELENKRGQIILRQANEAIRQWIDRQKKDAKVQRYATKP